MLRLRGRRRYGAVANQHRRSQMRRDLHSIAMPREQARMLVLMTTSVQRLIADDEIAGGATAYERINSNQD
jgi:hypothetical protein